MDSFPKQPAERRDIDVVTDDWMPESDYIQTATSVVSPSGLTIESTSVTTANTRAKVWVSGGADKVNYKVTTTITTHDGRIKEHEFMVKVREK